LADAAAALEKVARAGSGSECPAAFDKMVVEFDRLRRHVQTRVPPGEKDWLQ
jgi:mevalonate pyrophosphate decarboxylase